MSIGLRRREFIAALGGGAVGPLAAGAQQAAMLVIGYLESGVPELSASRRAAFRKGLEPIARYFRERYEAIIAALVNNGVPAGDRSAGASLAACRRR
jgi:hypothetical protein